MGPELEARHQGVAEVLVVLVDDRLDGQRHRHELHGQPGVGLVPAEREGHAAVVRQREAQAQVDGRLAAVVVLELAARFEVEDAQRVVEGSGGAAHAGPAHVGVVVADLLLDPRGERPLALLGDDVDDAADGVGAVERGLGPPDDLHADAVHQHLDLAGIGAADRDAGGLAEAARAPDLHAGHLAQRLVHRRVVIRLEVLAVDDGDGGSELTGRRLDLGGGDHDGIHDSCFRLRLCCFRLRVLRPRRPGGQRPRQRHGDDDSTAHLLHSFSRERVGTSGSGQVS